MNKRGVRWLYGELPGLVSKGVLSRESAASLREHYGELPPSVGRGAAVIVLAVFGALLIGLGVILVFAHNWQDLSRPTRVVLSLAPLILTQCLGGWVLLRASSSTAWKEGSATSIMLAVAAAISLVAQTYNISGDIPAFILTWMLLSLPLVYLFNASTPAALYLAGIAAWTGNVMHEGSERLCFWALLILFIPHYATAMIRDAGGFRATVLSWALLACISVATGFSIEGVMPGIWIVVYASLMTSIYLVGTLWFDDAPSAWRRPFQTVGQRGIVVLSFVLTFREPWRQVGWHYYGAHGYQTTFGAAADYAMAISLTILTVSLLLRCVRNGNTTALFLGVLPALAIVGYAASSAFKDGSLAMILFNVYVLVMSVAAIVGGIQQERLGLLNSGMLLLAALITARFFDSDVSMLTRGVVFILLGIGFLGANIWMLRRKAAAKEPVQ